MRVASGWPPPISSPVALCLCSSRRLASPSTSTPTASAAASARASPPPPSGASGRIAPPRGDRRAAEGRRSPVGAAAPDAEPRLLPSDRRASGGLARAYSRDKAGAIAADETWCVAGSDLSMLAFFCFWCDAMCRSAVFVYFCLSFLGLGLGENFCGFGALFGGSGKSEVDCSWPLMECWTIPFIERMNWLDLSGTLVE